MLSDHLTYYESSIFKANSLLKTTMKARGIFASLRRVLAHRHLPVVLAVAAFIIMLPALRAGLLNDDLCHRAELIGLSRINEQLFDVGLADEDSGRLSKAVSDLFVSVSPDKNLERLKNYGALPWWTYEGLRVSFWRPVSSFTHWLDYRVFANSVVMMHVHNILWFTAVIFLVSILYRQLIKPGWIAGLAAVLYVLDDNSYFPAMWIANRNIFLSLFFAVLTLLAHQRWRQHHSLVAAIVAPFCLLGSLLSAEAGIATFAYLFAYAITVERRSWIRRGLSLSPAVLVIVLWRIIHNAKGYGTYGGVFYLDPVREPLHYAWAVVERGSFLLASQWTSLPAEIFGFIPDAAKMQYWLILTILVILILIAFLPLLHRSRLARFWLMGMYLSVLPVCATIPMNRNLLFVGIGAFGLIAQFVGGFLVKESWLPKSRLWRTPGWVLCIMLLLIHLPMAGVGRLTAPKVTSLVVDEVKSTMEIGSLPGLENQDLVIVNAPNPASFIYMPFLRAYEGQPLPRAIRVLAPGFGPLEVFRTGKKALVLRARSGNLLTCKQGKRLNFVYLYEYLSDVRSSEHPLRVGDRIGLPRFSVEVIAVDDDGFPAEALFTFAVLLDDPSLRWLQWDWDNESYKSFSVPAIGERSEVAGPF